MSVHAVVRVESVYIASHPLHTHTTRVTIFREKKYSAEHGTDGNFDSFRRNSVFFRGSENARNSVPSHSTEDEKSSEFRSEPFRRREKHSELRNFVSNHSADDTGMCRKVDGLEEVIRASIDWPRKEG